MPMTFRILGRAGTTISTRETHAPLTAATQARLKWYVQGEGRWDDSLSALCSLWSIAALLSLDHNLSPAIRKALTVIMSTSDTTEEIELAPHLGRPRQIELIRLIDTAFGALRRDGATCNRPQTPDGYWITRVVEALENCRADYKISHVEGRKGIAIRVQTSILGITGRSAPLDLIERALDTRAPGSGKSLGSKWQRYLDVLNALGYKLTSVEALRRMNRRRNRKISV